MQTLQTGAQDTEASRAHSDEMDGSSPIDAVCA
jgi:hypothetical protein